MQTAIESIRDSAAISNQFFLYVALTAMAFGFLLIWWLSRRISEPLLELTDISRRMAELDFNAKFTSGIDNEIGVLGEYMNEMSENLEKTISELKTANNELQRDIEQKTQIDEMRKEFLSNVSHELKTPIALIQGYAEGLKECINDDAESRDFYCEVIMDEAAEDEHDGEKPAVSEPIGIWQRCGHYGTVRYCVTYPKCFEFLENSYGAEGHPSDFQGRGADPCVGRRV